MSKIPARGIVPGKLDFQAFISVTVLTMFLFLAPHASGQSSLPRMGVLLGGNEVSSRESLRQMRDGLREHGLVEGESILLVYRFANGDLVQLPSLANELVREHVNLLYVGGDAAIAAAKGATVRIPIVMVACDALAAGFVSNLSRPGGNLTGVTCINSDLAAKRMEILKEVLPSLRRVGAITYPNDVRVRHELAETLKAAPRLKLAISALEVSTPATLELALSQARPGGQQAIITINNAFTFFNRKLIADTALRNRLATISNFSEYADAGGLLTYGPSLGGMYRQATDYVARILKGAAPGELPVAQATRFELVVNLSTARALNITIPASVLVRSDRVIQ